MRVGRIEVCAFKKTMYLPLAVLGLCAVCGFSLVASSGGCSEVVCRRLIATASLVVEQGPLGARPSGAAACGLSSCGSWALEHRLSSCGART